MKTEVVHLSRLVCHPYEACMVPRYNSWMQDKELLRLTGSEPLTLEEEYQNQQSWAVDPQKFTFILCDRDIFDSEHPEQSMIGDINVFLTEPDVGELNLMIGEPSYRRKGLAREAVSFIKGFARQLNLVRLEAKIQADNTASLALFKSLGFEVFATEPAFNEVHLSFLLVYP